MLNELSPQQLDRHRPVQHHVQPPPHLPHRAGRDRLIQPVTAREHDAGEGHDGPDPTCAAAPSRSGMPSSADWRAARRPYAARIVLGPALPIRSRAAPADDLAGSRSTAAASQSLVTAMTWPGTRG
jgi:hypothetical protein